MAGDPLSTGLHRLLERQLRKCGVSQLEPPDLPAWSRLLPSIDAHYRAGDEDRYLLERSLEISSSEMRDLYQSVSTERSRLEAVLLALPQGVVVVDAADHILVCNRTATTFLEREPNIGETAMSYLHFERSGEALPLNEAVDTKDVYVVGALGKRTPVHTAVVTAGGEHRVITMTDLTEQLSAFAELHEARVSAEVALRAEQARATFLARMSHELRTPLNAILGYAELLADENLDPGMAADLQRICGAGTHLLGLINDVLDLSKLDARRMELDLKEVDLGALLKEASEDLRPLVEAQHNRLHLNLPSAVSAIVDAQKLKQCLYNLLSNAARYTENGDITVGLEAGAQTFVIEVTDSGTGIHSDDLERIFEPFSQTSASRGGTGLGLAIVKATCELMGGRCAVRSELGRGSTFQLFVPR